MSRLNMMDDITAIAHINYSVKKFRNIDKSMASQAKKKYRKCDTDVYKKNYLHVFYNYRTIIR